MTKIRPAVKRWGIVVGVDEYVSAGEYLHNLKGCVADARRMYDVMVDKDCCGFLEDHVTKLENPTYEEIETAFEEVGGKMKKGDELWFYYAGHGYSERRQNGAVSGYLLPSDVKLSRSGKLSAQGCISHSGLRDDLIARNITYGNINVVLFLDCCCAASVGLNDGNRSVCAGVREMSEDFTASFRDLSAVGPGGGESESWDFKYISFMATDKSGKAKEDESGGVFTKYLIEGLRGGREDCSTVAQKGADYYIRAGRLGAFLGEFVESQPPIQDFKETNYPLSVSSKKKLLQAQITDMNKAVIDWLTKMWGEKLVKKEQRQFAEDVMDESESSDFPYAGLMRNLMRLFSAPNQEFSDKLREGATLIQAFYDLKRLLDGKGPEGKDQPGGKPASPVTHVKPKETAPLSSHDRELLEMVTSRLYEVDGDGIDLSEIGRMSQADAAAALNDIARRRLREQCGRARYDALFTPNEQAEWSMKARRGFSTVFESAVYELVRDDKALSQRRK